MSDRVERRVEAAAWSLSWIPSESVSGALKRGFDIGLTHYDRPPDDLIDGIDDVRRLQGEDAFRFANVVDTWAEVHAGRITNAGLSDRSGLLMGSTTVRLSRLGVTFRGFSLPVLTATPEHSADHSSVTFAQTVGGRTGVPLPRRVPHPPFLRWQAPTVWTSLALTLHADGSAEVELRDASPFPRHWVYGPAGDLVGKSGLTDQSTWVAHSFGRRTPWGDRNSTALVAAAESALERQLSHDLMTAGRTPQIRRAAEGSVVIRQGEPGDELLLLLDGMLAVEVDGTRLAEVGPGAVLGERAILEHGLRTSTLVATTPVRLAVAAVADIDVDHLRSLAALHRREI